MKHQNIWKMGKNLIKQMYPFKSGILPCSHRALESPQNRAGNWTDVFPIQNKHCSLVAVRYHQQILDSETVKKGRKK